MGLNWLLWHAWYLNTERGTIFLQDSPYIINLGSHLVPWAALKLQWLKAVCLCVQWCPTLLKWLAENLTICKGEKLLKQWLNNTQGGVVVSIVLYINWQIHCAFPCAQRRKFQHYLFSSHCKCYINILPSYSSCTGKIQSCVSFY